MKKTLPLINKANNSVEDVNATWAEFLASANPDRFVIGEEVKQGIEQAKEEVSEVVQEDPKPKRRRRTKKTTE